MCAYQKKSQRVLITPLPVPFPLGAQRIEKELEERDYEEARAMLEAQRAKKGGAVGAKAGPAGAAGGAGAAGLGKDGERLDKRTIMAEAMSERIKEQQDMERKLTKMGKQLDHFERCVALPKLLNGHEVVLNGHGVTFVLRNSPHIVFICSPHPFTALSYTALEPQSTSGGGRALPRPSLSNQDG